MGVRRPASPPPTAPNYRARRLARIRGWLVVAALCRLLVDASLPAPRHRVSAGSSSPFRSMRLRGFLAAAAALGARALAPPRHRWPPATRLREGAHPELPYGTNRRSLRGIWRLRRDCEGVATEDIVVTLNARGEFSASYHPRGDVDEATAARHEAFAAAFYGRWYSDNEDDREVRLARFERKSPVDWYIAMPLDEDSPLTAYSGNVLEGAHSPEWIGKFEMTPLWPETHQLLPPPPIEAPPYNAKELAGDYYLVWTDGDDGETVLYSVSLGQDLKWASRGEEEFRGSASRREAGLAVRPSLPTRTLDDVSRLERAAAKEARADREWLLRAADLRHEAAAAFDLGRAVRMEAVLPHVVGLGQRHLRRTRRTNATSGACAEHGTRPLGAGGGRRAIGLWASPPAAP